MKTKFTFQTFVRNLVHNTTQKLLEKKIDLGNGPGSHDIERRVWSIATALTMAGSDNGFPIGKVLIMTLCSENNSFSWFDDRMSATRNYKMSSKEKKKLISHPISCLPLFDNLLGILYTVVDYQLERLSCHPYFDFDKISNHQPPLRNAIAPSNSLLCTIFLS